MIESAIFVALNVADAVLTYRILKNGGRELNPAMRSLMDKLGVAPALICAKVILISAILALDIGDYLWALNALYVGVVVWNLRVLKGK